MHASETHTTHAMPPPQPAGHKEVAESAAWYQYYARRGQKICYQRNLKAVLSALAVGQLGVDQMTRGRSRAKRPRSQSGSSRARGERLNRIVAQLSPLDLESPPQENMLRIDIKSLERKVDPIQDPKASDGERLAKKTKLPAIRCKCEMTIWYQLESHATRTSPWCQLLRDSEMCTIRRLPVDGGMATLLELDEVFHIKATKLFVPVKEQGRVQEKFARCYRLQIALMPVLHGNGDCPEGWPPVPLKTSPGMATPGVALDASDYVYRLEATMEGFLFTPADGSLRDVKYAVLRDGPKSITDYAMRLELLWTRPSETALKSPSPEKPVVDELGSPVARGSKGPVQVQYYLPGSHVDTVSGYRCLFCHGRNFHHEVLFKFHLVTDHDLIDFKFSNYDETDTAGLSPLIVHISPIPRASAKTPADGSTNWQWLRARDRRLDLEDYFKGDRSWITGKKEDVEVEKGREKGAEKEADTEVEEQMFVEEPDPIPQLSEPESIGQTSDSDPLRQASSDPDPIRQPSEPLVEPLVLPPVTESPPSAPLPTRAPSPAVPFSAPTPLHVWHRWWDDRGRQKYPVPAPPPDGFYVRTLTKRVLQEGEMLSESDDEIDETWRQRRHRQTISALPGLTDAEKAFVVRWNEHVGTEEIQATRFLPEVLTRFTMTHRAWLVQKDVHREFYKHVSRLLLMGAISHHVVQGCLGIIRSADGAAGENRT